MYKAWSSENAPPLRAAAGGGPSKSEHERHHCVLSGSLRRGSVTGKRTCSCHTQGRGDLWRDDGDWQLPRDVSGAGHGALLPLDSGEAQGVPLWKFVDLPSADLCTCLHVITEKNVVRIYYSVEKFL